MRIDVDSAGYAIPTVGPTVVAGVNYKPAQPEIGCNTRSSSKGDDSMVEVFEMGGNVAYKQVNGRPINQ